MRVAKNCLMAMLGVALVAAAADARRGRGGHSGSGESGGGDVDAIESSEDSGSSFDADNSGSGSDDAADDRADAADDAADAEADAADDAADAAEDAADDAADAADDAADSEAEAADDAADAAEDAADAAEEAADDAEDSQADAADDAADAADDAADAAEDAADDAEDSEAETADDAAAAADDAADAEADAAEDGAGSDNSGHGSDDSGSDETDSDSSGHGSGGSAMEDSDDAASNSGSGSSSSGSGSSHSGSGRDDGDRRRSDGDRHSAVRAEARQPVEYDREGYTVAAREVLALTDDASDKDTLQALGFTVTSREALPGVGLELLSIKVPGDRSAEAALAELVSRKSDAIFALNHVFTAGKVSRLAPSAARPPRRPPGQAAVGLIDGGVAHAALPAGIRLETANFAARGSAQVNHGSAVAALLAEAGVGRIYSANIFDGRNASAASMVRALDWMAGHKVPVINISLAGPPNPIVHRLIKILRARGHAIVAAVGNAGPAAPPLYPAAYPEVIGVTAVDARGTVYRRANRGPQTMLAAEGVNVPAPDGSGTLRAVSGTSFAAPRVSARLARAMTAPDAGTRDRVLADVVRRARDLGAPGRDPVFGFGLVRPDS